MEILPPERFPQRDRNALRAFLEYCRGRAAEAGEPRLVSISLKVRHIDPLAVLQAIYEPGEKHFYLECVAREQAIAGAEAIAGATFSGPDRFARVAAFQRASLDAAIAIGDADAPFFGPHCFCGFTFFEDAPTGEPTPFAPATVFIPRWQVGFRGGVYGAVANLSVAADSDLDALAEKVWRAHQRFASFTYGEGRQPASPPAGQQTRRNDIVDTERYEAMVRRALGRISEGAYEKIVLSRAVDIEAPAPYRPLELLNVLRRDYPACHCFSLANGAGQSFVGASPEQLARAGDGLLRTEALAGSAPRGDSAAEDAARGAQLLASEKDLREHRLVVEAIERRLRAAGLEPERPAPPRLLRLANVQHLLTPIRAPLPAGTPFLKAAEALHPTPALGGSPREAALAELRSLEPFERGLFGGLVGWLAPDGGGELVVAIRSGLVEGGRVRLYAGAGIVEGSDPAGEAAETELKFRALLPSFTGG